MEKLQNSSNNLAMATPVRPISNLIINSQDQKGCIANVNIWIKNIGMNTLCPIIKAFSISNKEYIISDGIILLLRYPASSASSGFTPIINTEVSVKYRSSELIKIKIRSIRECLCK